MKLRKRAKAKPRTLVILSTPRSGTHLLAHELAATGEFGLAEEFFHDQLLPEYGERFGADPASLASYIDAFHSQTAATNGVASVVVFPDHVDKLASAGALASAGPDGFAELLTMLPEPTVVLLERQSLVSQAVSFNRATQSWVWTRSKGQEAPPHPEYDFESLTAHLLRLVTIREWVLRAADLIGDTLGLRTTYEALVADTSSVVSSIGQSLGLAFDATERVQRDRPVRAADDESDQRTEALLDDIGALTRRLRWSPNSGTAETVAENISTVADRQLAAMAESVESHRASAFRRRPIVEAPADGGQLFRVRSALARTSTHVATVTSLVAGLDNWAIERLYGRARSSFDVSLVHAWADLATTADIVHINSYSLGLGLVGFDAKRALVAQAHAALGALAEREIPIIWTINEPLTPDTKHVALESELRAELAAHAAIIHATSNAVVERASELFAFDEQSVVVGALPAAAATQPHTSVRATDDDALLLLIAGSLGQYPELGKLAQVIPELEAQTERPCTLLVVGSTEQAGTVAHDLRTLADAGAVVVEMELDPASHEALVAQSDVVLAPCSSHACFVPIQQLAGERATPVIVTQCPGLLSGVATDWTDAAATAATTLDAVGKVHESPPTKNPVVTFDDLVAAISR